MINDIIAYWLPIIQAKELRIHSHNGTIVNGNKILADNKLKFLWQQFDGTKLNDENPISILQEIPTSRLDFPIDETKYANAQMHISIPSFFSDFFFRGFNWLVSGYNWFRFAKFKDARLPAKQLIYGISYNGFSKAYSAYFIDSESEMVIHDQLGATHISLIYYNSELRCFMAENIKLIDNLLIKDNYTWEFSGKALGTYGDLKSINVTSRAYWYMWLQFNPKTELYKN